MQRRAAIAALGLAALSACAASGMNPAATMQRPWRSTRLAGHPLVGTIWSAADGAPAGMRALAAALRAARCRLIGEVHDNPDHHALQRELLEDLAASGLRPVLAFEQFDRQFDPALQQRIARGNMDAEGVADAVNFDRKGWNWDYYRPLVEVALRHGLPLRAANLSRADARRIVREGLPALGAAREAALRLEEAWSGEREALLRQIVLDAHCGMLPAELVPGMTAAQRARDATLSEAMNGSGADGAILIAGNGHVRRDLGVPLYLGAAGTAACSVGILEVEDGGDDARDYNASAAGLPPQFDFIVFTPGWERPDPCASFTPRPAA